MEQEILKIIQEKLPSIHAEALGAFFTEAKQTKVDLGNTQNAFKVAQNDLMSMKEDNAELRQKLDKGRELTGREKAVQEKEQAQALLECRLECEKEKVALAKELFKDVFRNIEIKRSLIGTIPVDCPSGNYPLPGSLQKTETITQS